MKALLIGMAIAAAVFNAPKAQANTVLKPLIVIAMVKVQPGTEQAFKAAAEKILEPTHKEEGSISYLFNQSVSDPTEFSTVEVWRSQVDIDLHMQSATMQTFFKTVGPLFVSGYPVLNTYQSFGN